MNWAIGQGPGFDGLVWEAYSSATLRCVSAHATVLQASETSINSVCSLPSINKGTEESAVGSCFLNEDLNPPNLSAESQSKCHKETSPVPGRLRGSSGGGASAAAAAASTACEPGYAA